MLLADPEGDKLLLKNRLSALASGLELQLALCETRMLPLPWGQP